MYQQPEFSSSHPQPVSLPLFALSPSRRTVVSHHLRANSKRRHTFHTPPDSIRRGTVYRRQAALPQV